MKSWICGIIFFVISVAPFCNPGESFPAALDLDWHPEKSESTREQSKANIAWFLYHLKHYDCAHGLVGLVNSSSLQL
jgi:hypothetical protein